jgi:hypothetical protein
MKFQLQPSSIRFTTDSYEVKILGYGEFYELNGKIAKFYLSSQNSFPLHFLEHALELMNSIGFECSFDEESDTYSFTQYLENLNYETLTVPKLLYTLKDGVIKTKTLGSSDKDENISYNPIFWDTKKVLDTIATKFNSNILRDNYDNSYLITPLLIVDKNELSNAFYGENLNSFPVAIKVTKKMLGNSTISLFGTKNLLQEEVANYLGFETLEVPCTNLLPIILEGIETSLSEFFNVKKINDNVLVTSNKCYQKKHQMNKTFICFEDEEEGCYSNNFTVYSVKIGNTYSIHTNLGLEHKQFNEQKYAFKEFTKNTQNFANDIQKQLGIKPQIFEDYFVFSTNEVNKVLDFNTFSTRVQELTIVIQPNRNYFSLYLDGVLDVTEEKLLTELKLANGITTEFENQRKVKFEINTQILEPLSVYYELLKTIQNDWIAVKVEKDEYFMVDFRMNQNEIENQISKEEVFASFKDFLENLEDYQSDDSIFNIFGGVYEALGEVLGLELNDETPNPLLNPETINIESEEV